MFLPPKMSLVLFYKIFHAPSIKVLVRRNKLRSNKKKVKQMKMKALFFSQRDESLLLLLLFQWLQSHCLNYVPVA